MNRFVSWLSQPWGAYSLVWIVISGYWLLRVFAFSGLSADEAEQVLFAQAFQWGYDVTNPPMYTWVLASAFAVFGKSVAVVLGVKYALLFAIYAALYEVARMVLGEDRKLDRALVALSPFLIFFTAWNSVFNYSHSLMNALFVILAVMSALRLHARGTWLWYLVFGVVLGLGGLAKYAFALFAIALIAAGVSSAEMRARLANWRILITIGAAGLVLAPHVWWLVGQADALQEALNYKLQRGDDAPYWNVVLKGLWNVIRALFAFMSPLWLVTLLVFPAAFKRTPRSERAFEDVLLGRTFVIVLALIIFMVLFGGVSQFRPNYLFALIVFPLWVFLRLPAEAEPGKRRRIYAALVLVGAVLSLAGLAGKVVVDPSRCDKCQYTIPYEKIADELHKAGFHGGSVVAYWYPAPLPGNLAVYLKNARMVSIKFRRVKPPRLAQTDQCLLVWMPDDVDPPGGLNPTYARGEAKAIFDAEVPADAPVHRFSVTPDRAPEKKIWIDYILLQPGNGDCR